MIVGTLEEWAGTESARTATSRAGSASAADGHCPAGAHAPERGAGVEGAQGERDRAEQQQVHDSEQVGRPPEGRIGGEQRRDDRDHERGGDQHQRGRGKTQLACSGRVRSRRASLRRSSSGWRIGGPTRPSSRQRTLRIRPDQKRAAEHHGEHLKERDRHHGDDRPGGRSSDHHQHDDEGHQPEGQVAVHAAVGHPAGDRSPPVDSPGRRTIDDAARRRRRATCGTWPPRRSSGTRRRG